MELKGKVALVSGGASGFGREYCTELFKQGCKVSICDIDINAGRELLNKLRSCSGESSEDKVIFCECDVTDYTQFEEAFQRTITTFGTLSIVINAATIMNDKLWELEVDVNLNGVIRGLLLAIRFMGKDKGGTGGVVVNSGSSTASTPFLSMPIFTATNTAIHALTHCYGSQYHLNLSGVKVIGLCPTPAEELNEDEPQKRIMNAKYEAAWKNDVNQTLGTKPETVGKALVEVLQKAKSGTSWVFENSKNLREVAHFT